MDGYLIVLPPPWTIKPKTKQKSLFFLENTNRVCVLISLSFLCVCISMKIKTTNSLGRAMCSADYLCVSHEYSRCLTASHNVEDFPRQACRETMLKSEKEREGAISKERENYSTFPFLSHHLQSRIVGWTCLALWVEKMSLTFLGL